MRVRIGLIIILIFLLFAPISNVNALVDSETIENWANSYIDKYMETIEEQFGQEYGFYFDFYGKHPFLIKTLITSNNGIAIEMIPRSNYSEMKYISYFTDNKIEDALFYNNILENAIINKTTFNDNKNLINNSFYIFDLPNSYDIFFISVCTISGNHYFFNMSNSELLIVNSTIDGVYYNYLYVNNRNKSTWTEENANKTSLNHIKRDIPNIFYDALNNDEFKEYFASAPLEEKISNIKFKYEENLRNSSFNYPLLEFENDIKDVYNTAYKEYGITNDLLQRIIRFLDAGYIFPSENVSVQDDEWKGWQFGVGLSVLQLIIIISYIRYEKKLKQLKAPVPFGITISIIYGWLYTSYLDKIIAILNNITLIKSFLTIMPFIPLIITCIFYKKLKNKLQMKGKQNKKHKKTKNK